MGLTHLAGKLVLALVREPQYFSHGSSQGLINVLSRRPALPGVNNPGHGRNSNAFYDPQKSYSVQEAGCDTQ